MSGEPVRDHPPMIARPDHVEPVPRRIRAVSDHVLDGELLGCPTTRSSRTDP
jgi:hypothetical protein